MGEEEWDGEGGIQDLGQFRWSVEWFAAYAYAYAFFNVHPFFQAP